jgi:hypothetical protein
VRELAGHRTDGRFSLQNMKRQLGLAMLKMSVLIAFTGLNGCLIPEGTKVTSGHKYSNDAFAFLERPDANRAETISNLGPPSWESYDSRVLLYLWRTSFDWLFVPPENKWGIGQSHVVTDEKRMALLIAYDEQGRIINHAVRSISEDSLENICSRWSRRQAKR